MTDTKSPFGSLTISAAVLGLLVQTLSICGVEIAPDAIPDLTNGLNSVLAAIAFIVAIYGRIRARKRISAAE